MVKSGGVYQFSFAYDVKSWAEPTEEQKAKGIANVLTKVDLYEVSVVVCPANQNAVVTDIKSGKRNSKKDADAIKQAITLLQGVLDNEEDDSEETEETPKANEDTTSKELEEINARKDALLSYIATIK